MWKKDNLQSVVDIGIDCDGKHGQRGGERERRERENGVSEREQAKVFDDRLEKEGKGRME